MTTYYRPCTKCGELHLVNQPGIRTRCWDCHVDRVGQTQPNYCECRTPVVEPIPLFQTAQCGLCKRPFR